MTDASHNPGNYCYKHPDRQSYILCQRCGRTVCTDCQTQAAVGVHCPECVREGRQEMDGVRRTKSAGRTARRIFAPSSTIPVVTYSIMALCVVVYLAQIIPGSPVGTLGTYYPFLTEMQPWRMLTSAFLHGSILHLAFNMFSLFIFGPILENMLGRARFLVLYLVSALGGSVAFLALNPSGAVLGASGAIFGLMGAFFVIQRGLGGSNIQIMIVLGINLVSGFILPGVAWQAHLGGVVVGAGLAFLYMRTRHRNQRVLQVVLTVAIVLVLIAASAIAFSIHSG